MKTAARHLHRTLGELPGLSRQHKSAMAASPPFITKRRGLTPPLAALGILAALAWSYWSTLISLYSDWQHDDNYSVGMLVPIAALYLLWQDRRKLATCVVAPCWWGLGLIFTAQAARAYGLVFLFESAERYSLVLTIAGLVLLIAGTQVFRRTAWILLFLFLMVPLPGRIHNRIAGPLQDLATMGAVATLELFGVSVEREGHVMVLNETTRVAVAEACSGLRMLTAFIVVAAVLAYVINRPRWQKLMVLASSIPIAIICNLLRLFVTAELFLHTSSKTAEVFFHDFAGWTMMPLAILALLGELWVLAKLVSDERVQGSGFRVQAHPGAGPGHV
jgi:exosortase